VAPALHIVASCADRKKLPAAVRLRDVEGANVARRFSAWRNSISGTAAPRARAEELYQGGYWSIVRELPGIATKMGWSSKLWIASAGYGVVSGDTQLVSYSATFSSGHADSVSIDDEEDASKKWWRCATATKGGLGVSLASLTQADPNATVLIVASPAYVDAMEDDLVAAVGHVRNRGAVLIVSSRSPSDKALLSTWIPSLGALQSSLGGALVSLHARVARHLILSTTPRNFRKEKLADMTTKLGEGVVSSVKRAAGSAVSDDDVIAFIRQRLAADPKGSHTRLLRELRDSGQACEQGRFRRLFKQVNP
jgi:hypothetical protein